MPLDVEGFVPFPGGKKLLLVLDVVPDADGAREIPGTTAHDADKAMLWDALGRAGLHPFYRNLLTQALHQRVLEEIELERAQHRQRPEVHHRRGRAPYPRIEFSVSLGRIAAAAFAGSGRK